MIKRSTCCGLVGGNTNAGRWYDAWETRHRCAYLAATATGYCYCMQLADIMQYNIAASSLREACSCCCVILSDHKRACLGSHLGRSGRPAGYVGLSVVTLCCTVACEMWDDHKCTYFARGMLVRVGHVQISSARLSTHLTRSRPDLRKHVTVRVVVGCSADCPRRTDVLNSGSLAATRAGGDYAAQSSASLRVVYFTKLPLASASTRCTSALRCTTPSLQHYQQ